MSDGVDEYGWASHDGPESCGYIPPAVLEILKWYPRIQRVCDLGSGNGAMVGELKRNGYLPTGVEYDSGGVAIARQAYPGIPFYNLGVQDDPAQVVGEQGAFDAVVSTEVVEHLFSPHLLPYFALGLLAAGGLLIVSTPYYGFWKNLALSLSNKWDHHHTALWHDGHIKFWSRKTLTQLLENNRFRVIAFHGVGRAPYLWKSMILVAEAI